MVFVVDSSAQICQSRAANPSDNFVVSVIHIIIDRLCVNYGNTQVGVFDWGRCGSDISVRVCITMFAVGIGAGSFKFKDFKAGVAYCSFYHHTLNAN